MGETSGASTRAAGELFRQSLHWRDVSAQDGEPTMRLQHAAMAAAFLQAARAVARDAELERAAGVSVSRTARSLDDKLYAAREACTIPKPT